MRTTIEYLNAHLTIVSAVLVALTWGVGKLLPQYLDIGKLSQYGWLGTVGQLAITAVTVGGAALLLSVQDGALTQAELLAAGQAVLEALGIVAGVKQLSPGRAKRKQLERLARPQTAKVIEDMKKTGTTLIALAAVLLMSGCQQVKDASDFVKGVCEGYMSATPEVQAEAQRKAVNPFVIAEAICLANDAGRAIWELFQVQAPDGRMTAAPQPQIERAKARALVVAKQQGIIQ